MTQADFQKLFNKGRRLAGKRRFSEAIQYFERALQLDPNSVDTIFQLGNVSKAMGLFDVAIKWYDIAHQVRPDSIEISFNRANALQMAGRENEALEAFAAVAPYMPNDEKLWNSVGLLFQQMAQTVDAIDALEKAVALKPNYYEAWNNLGLSYFVGRYAPVYAGKWEPAFKKAERGFRNNPQFHVNRATCHFWSGNYEEGWRDYSYRHSAEFKSSVVHHHKLPWWKGEDLSDKTILIGEEQGIGDQVTFASAVNYLNQVAKRVILEVNPKLVSLFQRSFPNVRVVAPAAETIDLKRHHHYEWLDEPVDYFTPIGDAFYYSRAIENNQLATPFLKPDSAVRDKWRERLSSLGAKPKVGISWRSSNMGASRKEGYLTLETLAPFLQEMQQFQFINIQYGDCAEELSALPSAADGSPLVTSFDDLDLFDDIDGTAAMMSELNFVLSVRNTQACLAGALGKKTITYYGSFLQFGRVYTDPVFPTILTTLPHEHELPITEQFRNGLVDFEHWHKVGLSADGCKDE